MNKEAFIKLIQSVESVYDPYTQTHYEKFEAEGDYIHYLRKTRGGWDKLYLKDFYNAYLEREYINSSIMESYVPRSSASMAFELLKAAGIYNENGDRIV